VISKSLPSTSSARSSISNRAFCAPCAAFVALTKPDFHFSTLKALADAVDAE
jgi:hypothetical protein